MFTRILEGVTAAAILVAVPTNAFAADQLTIQVGFAPGAGFDLIARAAANHVGSHLPGNPSVIVENVEGAGSLRLLNLYLAAGARDGTQIVMVSPAFALDPILNPDNITFDPGALRYLISFSNLPSYCITSIDSGIVSFDDLIGADDVKVAAVGRGASYLLSSAVNRAFDANFSIVTGFTGVSEIALAMARGEIDAFCGLSYSSIQSTRGITEFNVVAELSPVAFNLVAGAEYILDRVADSNLRAALGLVFSASLVWYPMLAHPDTPADTVATLREAFAALATDPDFLAEAHARGIDVSITPGEEVQRLIQQFLSVDEAVKSAARALVQ